jgi:hypothetical protein
MILYIYMQLAAKWLIGRRLCKLIDRMGYRSILKLLYYLCLGFPSGPSPSGFLTKILHTLHMSAMCKGIRKRGMTQRFSQMTWKGWRKLTYNVYTTSLQSFTVCNPQKLTLSTNAKLE